MTASDVEPFSSDLLNFYYQRLFPFEPMHKWLSYGDQAKVFGRREFSFTIEGDIYIRYQSFKTLEEMKDQVCKKRPHKIDLGAVFTVPPREHTSVKPGAFQPVERELVFDIDLTDYDDIRTCCSGASICEKCWHYMSMAVEVLDTGLREDFGFEHLLWVYSGRRGIHCWVCDSSARALSNEARSAVAEYFTVITGSGDNQAKKVNLSAPVHPSLQRAFKTLEPLFIEHIISEDGQGLLSNPDNFNKILDLIPYQELAEQFLAKWRNDGSSPAERWEELVAGVDAKVHKEMKTNASKRQKSSQGSNELWQYEVIFTHTYPRLDKAVSTHQNHLLKSPFVAHPKTGRVCVPINPKHVNDFNPFAVPTLGLLQKQVDDSGGDTDKTDLKQYLTLFSKEFLQPLQKALRKHQRDQSEMRAAISGDF
ncbi:unnamed protein product [Chrysoparadoxa australica]